MKTKILHTQLALMLTNQSNYNKLIITVFEVKADPVFQELSLLNLLQY